MSIVTIGIPFYRGLDYLREAVESVRAQSSSAWRLVIIDDSGGAGGGVEDVVAELDDRRIVLHRNAGNLGMVATWNRCLAEAESDLVSLLHGDDRLLPGYVEQVADLADRHPEAAAVYCDACIIDATGAPVFSLPDAVKRLFAPSTPGEVKIAGEAGTAALMAGNFIMCPTLCFRKSVLRERRFEASWTQVQDLALTTRLLMDGDYLVGSPEVGYAYRRHDESATHLQSESRIRFDEEFRLFDDVSERAQAMGWERAARVAGRKRIVKLHLLYRCARDLARLRVGSAGATVRYLASKW